MIIKILIWVLGGITIALYAFFSIKKTIKWRNRVKYLTSHGYDLIQAKEIANNEIYKKKKKRKKENDKESTEDKPFEE